MNLIGKLMSMKHDPSIEKVDDYLIRLEELRDGLAQTGEVLSQDMVIGVCIHGLPEKYEYFKTVQKFGCQSESYDHVKKALKAYALQKEDSTVATFTHEMVATAKTPSNKFWAPPSMRQDSKTCTWCGKCYDPYYSELCEFYVCECVVYISFIF
eukprot:GHVS01074326.1.p1 GENE.GHVS01074326.1~~GHVS01074326.1.p1  ORF type:complete len:154 (-),score=7.86 GHVS01074326.1:70-531(-)